MLILSTAIVPSLNLNSFPNANAIELDPHGERKIAQMYADNNDMFGADNKNNEFYLQQVQPQQQKHFDYDSNSYIYKNTNPYNYNDNYASNEYNDYSDKENNKYECQKGLFEGFFVSSPEFCVQKEPPKEEPPKEEPPKEEPPKEEPPKEEPSIQKENLTVVKNTECQANLTTCNQNPVQSSNFTIVIEGNNPSQTSFPGSSNGTNIQLEPGTYNVTEQGLDPVIPAICNTMGFDAGRVASDIGQNLITCTDFSDECDGNITLGNPQTCTIDNVIVQLVVIGNTVYAVWEEEIDSSDTDIFFAKSVDGGQTFSSPINISYTPGTDSFNQSVAVSENNVSVVWEEQGNPIPFRYISTSIDGGETFGIPKINNTQQLVYLAYQSSGSIFFAKSVDGGQNFFPTNVHKISTTSNGDPQIAASGNAVYVVWEEGEDILMVKSTDSGEHFGNPKNLSSSETRRDVDPTIDVSGNIVSVGWGSSDMTNDVFISTSTDGGDIFDTPIIISTKGDSPDVAVLGNAVYIVWRDYSLSPQGDIFFSASTDNGINFTTPKEISQTVDRSNTFNNIPKITVDQNNIHVVWERGFTTTPSEIFYTTSTDGGQHFGTQINISNSTNKSQDPAIDALGNNIYIIWEEDDFDQYLSTSTDGGQEFSIGKRIDLNNGANISLGDISIGSPIQDPNTPIDLSKLTQEVWVRDISNGLIGINENGPNIRSVTLYCEGENCVNSISTSQKKIRTIIVVGDDPFMAFCKDPVGSNADFCIYRNMEGPDIGQHSNKLFGTLVNKGFAFLPTSSYYLIELRYDGTNLYWKASIGAACSPTLESCIYHSDEIPDQKLRLQLRTLP